MKMLFIAVVAILLTNTIVLSQQCFASSGSFLTPCTTVANNMNARSNLVPSAGRTLTVFVTTTINARGGACNAVTAALVAIGDPRSATRERRLASIFYNFDTQELLWAQDTIVGVLMRSPQSLVGRQINGAISIDLSTGNIRYAVRSESGIASHGVTVADIRQIATFNSNTMFYFCNWNRACCGSHNCAITGTGVIPIHVEDHRALALMDIPILVGSFQFLEGTGSSSSSSVVPRLNAQFGGGAQNQANAPRWMNPGPGLDFTSISQFMTISGIDGSARFPNVGFSSGISVWIRVQGVPPQTILRFRTAQSTVDEGTVTLTNTRAIQTTWLGNTVASSLTVQHNVWTHVVIIMNSASPSLPNNCFLRMYFGLTDVGSRSATCPVPASTTYSVTAGGYVGQMQDLLIFRAPAGFVSSPACAPRPVIALGSNPNFLLVRSTCPNGILTRSVCSSCSAVCTTCSDTQQCLTCMPGFFLDATSNSCRQCPISRFALTRNARTCDGVCQTGCGACLDSSTCRSCLPGFALRGAECFRCGVGTFTTDGTSSLCNECPATCLTCTSRTECQSCREGLALINRMCVSCPRGTYLESSICRSCPNSCADCSRGPSTCDSCQEGHVLVNGECDTCRVGTFPDATATMCISCPSSCTSCKNSSICTTCQEGFALIGDQCVTCPTGTYPEVFSCRNCPSSCTNCTSSSVCTGCQEGLALIDGQCVTCPSGTFSGATFCESCPSSCTNCKNSSICTGCQEGHALVNGKCETCPAGTFADATVCRSCPSSCTSCRTSSICTGCQEGHLLVGDQCLACPSGTFSGATFCERCPSLCTNCRSSSICTGCEEGHPLIDGQCVTCPSGTSPTAISCEKTETEGEGETNPKPETEGETETDTKPKPEAETGAESEGEVINDDDKPLDTSDTTASNGSVIAITIAIVLIIVIAVVISVLRNYLKQKERNGKGVDDITNESQIQAEFINSSNIDSIKPKAVIAL